MRRRVIVTASAVLLVAGCGSAQGPVRATHTAAPVAPASASPSPASPSPAPPPSAAPLPLTYETDDATQVITVVANATTSTSAILQAWTKRPGCLTRCAPRCARCSLAGWEKRGPAIHADIGNQGMTGEPSENLAATPMGSFTLTQAFGRAGNPGTPLPYFRTDLSDYWVADTASVHYNTHYRCARSCPFDTGAGESLYRVGYIYTYAVVMDYNRFPVRAGAGSAFFLHVTEHKPTTGCISIDQQELVSIMRWLDPAAHPRMLVGVTR